jgi:hypothetical protein
VQGAQFAVTGHQQPYAHAASAARKDVDDSTSSLSMVLGMKDPAAVTKKLDGPSDGRCGANTQAMQCFNQPFTSTRPSP